MLLQILSNVVFRSHGNMKSGLLRLGLLKISADRLGTVIHKVLCLNISGQYWLLNMKEVQFMYRK